MSLRIICPHCHRPIDPLTLEAGFSAGARYRICPECDEPMVLSMAGEDDGETAPDREQVPA